MKKSILFLITIILLTGCYPANQKLSKKMIDMYEKDENYINLCGEIIAYGDSIVTIKCDKLKIYINYQGDICDYYIYSSQKLELNVGDVIGFVTVPYHFYNGHKLPIVEIVINGVVLLDFYDGKTNLINWVNANF